ncbi:DUF998 domain-containing protein [Nocardioides sp. KC13]|uniref:DUF998 domain-containing protein n=1 Tax=Nocardioides turkmenicus TaxID=2711220 RepID=A0A6M1R7W6_9ACTN|nr:DUF998 domain-containing protein [Nocardioides sp. KC13]NGN95752.1 DUF998 domain-containing protein [Nocardioides sp. KC13]
MTTGADHLPRSLLRLSALCGLFAPIVFTAAWVVGGIVQPDAYSVVDDAISDLGARTADHAWIYNQIGANLTGLLVMALAFGLWRARPPGVAGGLGVIALAVVGAGVFLDGWLRLDCRSLDAGCDNGGSSGLAVAHQIESLVTVLGLLVSVFALAYAFGRGERWRDLRTPTLIAGIATVAAFIGLSFVGLGLGPRVGLTVWFAWLALVSRHLMRTTREPRHPDIQN